MMDRFKEFVVYALTLLSLLAIAATPIVIGSIPGWAQCSQMNGNWMNTDYCDERIEVARLRTIVGGGVPAAEGCTCATTLQSCVEDASGDVEVYLTRQVGQSFSHSEASARTVCSVILMTTDVIIATSGNMTIKIDDDIDLSADTLYTATIAVTGLATDTPFTITLTGTPPALDPTTTYYIGFEWSGNYTNRIILAGENNDDCPVGKDGYATTDNDWNFTGHSRGKDMYLVIKACNP